MNFDNELASSKILIVDDQRTNVVVLQKMLAQAGYQHIFFTTDARNAAAMYFELNVDLLLLDIRMPHLDGFQVLEQLRSGLSDDDYLPILVLTAELSSATRSRALENGAKDFLTKPFDRLETLQRIRNILEVRLLHRKLRNYNEKLELQVKKRTQELEHSRIEVIRKLGRAAEYKDNETGNHIVRMSKFAQLLGGAAGLEQAEAEMIWCAAPMHDIGKIGIPDRILLKQGPLDSDEWEIMKTHAEIGSDILSGSDSQLLKMAARIAISHHEKWDGSGYPNGLCREEIPIEGRICSICDVFDALTSVRPYKPAWPIDKALEFIKENSGSFFDPHLVELFENIFDQILAYRALHLDSSSTVQ
ncbi:MAG: HD domain-containing phosphohydrolase [Gammaproteobacteria bacterium]